MFGFGERRLGLGGDHLGNLVLEIEAVFEYVVVAIRLDMVDGGAVDQLGGTPNPLARYVHASLKHAAHPKCWATAWTLGDCPSN
ncbi:MAG: hypothetical protein VYE18_08150 [Pseudomonadota bacterium]|nr:hypothetical protein [Pseudomonadota bacterium]